MRSLAFEKENELLTTLGLVVHAVIVEAQRLVRSIDRNGNRPFLEQCHFQRCHIISCDVHVAGDAHSRLHCVRMANAVRTQVTAICILGAETVLHDIAIGAEIFSTITGVVSEAPRAVHKLLLGQPNAHAMLWRNSTRLKNKFPELSF